MNNHQNYKNSVILLRDQMSEFFIRVAYVFDCFNRMFNFSIVCVLTFNLATKGPAKYQSMQPAYQNASLINSTSLLAMYINVRSQKLIIYNIFWSRCLALEAPFFPTHIAMCVCSYMLYNT